MAYGSLSFPGGSADYLTLGVGNGPQLAADNTSPFTIECWAYIENPSTSKAYPMVTSWDGSDSASWTWLFDASGNQMTLAMGTSSVGGSSGPKPIANRWAHYAVVRDVQNIYMFVDGVLQLSTTKSFVPTDRAWRIGISRSAADTFKGLIADIRVSTVARYTTAGYTVPTAPLPVDADTIMSLSFDVSDTETNNLTDKSPGAYGTYTNNGSVFVSGLNPFSPLSGIIDEINIVKAQHEYQANKFLLLPEDPLIDQAVVFPERAYETYRT